MQWSKEKDKRTNNDIQNATQKTKYCNNMINILNTLILIRSTVLKTEQAQKGG